MHAFSFGAVPESGPTDPDRSAARLGAALVDCVVRRDFDGLQALFADDVRFRALIPRSIPQAGSARDARTIMEGWFSDTDRAELLGSTIETVADRLQVVYRVRGREGGAWYLVEQHVSASIAGDRLTDVALVCSGFRPVEAPTEDARRAIQRASAREGGVKSGPADAGSGLAVSG